MWQEILNKFKRFPAQEKVIRLILQRGFQVNDRGRVVSGAIEIPHAQIAKELDVDRRVVDTTAMAIREDERPVEDLSQCALHDLPGRGGAHTGIRCH